MTPSFRCDSSTVLTRLSPGGHEVVAEMQLFRGTAWTVPALVGTTLFARDRQQIVALDLGRRPAGGPQ
ncbi:MAG: hypothetical protein Q8O42_10940 [Acidobacteriota bacterium]|nr:hypothetical protein [Acidobacteriota bacterium]